MVRGNPLSGFLFRQCSPRQETPTHTVRRTTSESSACFPSGSHACCSDLLLLFKSTTQNAMTEHEPHCVGGALGRVRCSTPCTGGTPVVQQGPAPEGLVSGVSIEALGSRASAAALTLSLGAGPFHAVSPVEFSAFLPGGSERRPGPAPAPASQARKLNGHRPAQSQR